MANSDDASSLSSTIPSSTPMHFSQNKTVPGDSITSRPNLGKNTLSAPASIFILPSTTNLFSALALWSGKYHAGSNSTLPIPSERNTLYGLYTTTLSPPRACREKMLEPRWQA